MVPVMGRDRYYVSRHFPRTNTRDLRTQFFETIFYLKFALGFHYTKSRIPTVFQLMLVDGMATVVEILIFFKYHKLKHQENIQCLDSTVERGKNIF